MLLLSCSKETVKKKDGNTIVIECTNSGGGLWVNGYYYASEKGEKVKIGNLEDKVYFEASLDIMKYRYPNSFDFKITVYKKGKDQYTNSYKVGYTYKNGSMQPDKLKETIYF